MNIGEATDVNTVLRYLTGTRDTGGTVPADNAAEEACIRLAGRVNKAIRCGITPEQVAAVWHNVEVCPAQDGDD